MEVQPTLITSQLTSALISQSMYMIKNNSNNDSNDYYSNSNHHIQLLLINGLVEGKTYRKP